MLQHLWSLAIEEQFYLVWPLVLMALGRYTKRRLTPVLFTAVLAAASAIWMAVQFDPFRDPSHLYYGTDAHASALLVGALLALSLTPNERRVGGDAAVLLDCSGLFSLALIAWVMVTQGQYSPFLYHGGFTIIAGLTAVAIAAALYGCPVLTLLLRGRTMRWIGSRSYGIYLWHWPIFLVTRPRSDLPWPTWQIDGVRILATFCLAELSFRFVESPTAAERWFVWVLTCGPKGGHGGPKAGDGGPTGGGDWKRPVWESWPFSCS